ncbi:hypothetical protein LshimejAT787_1601310 [Lyophyllum shimeji]|uniref:Uncharacterized protein n=1 Tax=Lyophyllum shimeji TaxID=47721 RepID=A0A9P3UVJ1_LYOSH|nr:hypothetical protein LshimejAT787_1601310 [Lyophyllum shimeji]
MKFPIFAAASLLALIAPVTGVPAVNGDSLIQRDAATPATPAEELPWQPRPCKPWEWWCQRPHERKPWQWWCQPGCKPWQWWCKPPRCKPWQWWCQK